MEVCWGEVGMHVTEEKPFGPKVFQDKETFQVALCTLVTYTSTVTRLIGTYSWTLRKWWGLWCRTRGWSPGRPPCAAAGTSCSGSRRRHSSITEGLKKVHDLVYCLPKHPGSASIDLDLTFKSLPVTWTVFHGWMGKAWQFLFQLLIAWNFWTLCKQLRLKILPRRPFLNKAIAFWTLSSICFVTTFAIFFETNLAP